LKLNMAFLLGLNLLLLGFALNLGCFDQFAPFSGFKPYWAFFACSGIAICLYSALKDDLFIGYSGGPSRSSHEDYLPETSSPFRIPAEKACPYCGHPESWVKANTITEFSDRSVAGVPKCGFCGAPTDHASEPADKRIDAFLELRKGTRRKTLTLYLFGSYPSSRRAANSIMEVPS
jgi:hypothetical protein